MKKAILVLALALAGMNAEAKSINFSFEIHSSGNDIYVCNAGLRQLPAGSACYIDGNPSNASCNPNACVANQPCNCVCTGGNGGTYLSNFITASYRAYGTQTNHNVVLNTRNFGSSTFAKLFDDNSPTSANNSWANVITALSFDLGSEVYGAEYFVDVCFRGSQIDYFLNGTAAPHALTSMITLTDLNLPGTDSSLKYATLAGLQGSVTVSCDLQGKGANKYAADSTGNLDSLVNDTNIASYNTGDFGLNSSWVSLSAGNNATPYSQYFINGANGIPAEDAPRFCKARYNFKETSSAFRKWQRHDAQVCIYTSIEEALASGGAVLP